MDFLLCSRVDHYNESIIALCTLKGCLNVRKCCSKCIAADHKSHISSVIELQDLQNKYQSNYHPLLQLVDDLRKRINQSLTEIEKAITSIEIPIYPKQINLTNINRFVNQLVYCQKFDFYNIKESILRSHWEVKSSLRRCLSLILQDNEESLKMRKAEAEILRNKGYQLRQKGEYQEAIEFYDRSIEIYDQDNYCWNEKGYALWNLQKYELAIECYDHAILINPNDSIYYSNKAHSLLDLNKLHEALECVNKGLDLNPNCAGSWGNKGLILSQMNKKEEALKCYEKAVQIAPSANKCFNLASSLEELGRKNEALKFYQQAVKLDPTDQESINKVKELQNR